MSIETESRSDRRRAARMLGAAAGALLLVLFGHAAASDFDDAILAAHNRARAEVGAPPLIWNAALADGAMNWARHLAERGRLAHSPSSDRGSLGENLWMGTAGRYSAGDMVGGWTAEKKDFVYGIFPAVALDGDWRAVGHYTQVVWRESRAVGCALATSRDWDVLVCRYSPAGNTVGQRPY